MSFIDPESMPKTGNGIIDYWHGHLARSVNHAYTSWHRKVPAAETARAITAFFEDIKRHFTQEESIVRGAGYDDWRHHVKLHQEILLRLDGLTGELEDGDFLETFGFIDSLIYDHEFLEDQDFWELFQVQSKLDDGTPLVIWRPEFALGIKELDRDHQALTVMLDALYEMVLNKRDAQVIVQALNDIRSQTADHFAREEKYAERHSIEAFAEHREMHAYVLEDLDRMIGECGKEPTHSVQTAAEHYLRFWFLDHIINADDCFRR